MIDDRCNIDSETGERNSYDDDLTEINIIKLLDKRYEDNIKAIGDKIKAIGDGLAIMNKKLNTKLESLENRMEKLELKNTFKKM